ncbi:CoA ester lyase [Herpetosiphon gulosus]|uniref:L-malyl-CoA/beta-methylmalyl-CoA lyase n=1 Tax=Herpetosiphon gulosus TaxID=1973496 RepID=A0ABP9WYM7_9CHLR
MSSRIRRSEMTCPAHSLAMITKAAASEADEVIIDLEDACAVSQKIAARATVIQALQSLDFGQKIVAVRPNAVQTHYHYRDVVEIVEAAGAKIDVLVIPKIESADDVRFVDRLLSQIEANIGLKVGTIKLEVLIEGTRALQAVEQITNASPRLESLIFGLADYAGDLGARSADDQWGMFAYPKHKMLVAAKAAGLEAIDNVTFAFRDAEACQRDAERAATMGFDGKWAIHPAQVPIINQAFLPSAAEIAEAQRLINAYQAADQQAGLGAIAIDDQMIDAASLRVHAKKLALAQRAGLIAIQP